MERSEVLFEIGRERWVTENNWVGRCEKGAGKKGGDEYKVGKATTKSVTCLFVLGWVSMKKLSL